MNRSDFKHDLPCPFCKGTGRYTSDEPKRCADCHGSGLLSVEPKIYCECQLGRDLRVMDARLEAKVKRQFQLDYTTGETS